MAASSKDIENAPAHGGVLPNISSSKLRAKIWGIDVAPMRLVVVVSRPRNTWGVKQSFWLMERSSRPALLHWLGLQLALSATQNAEQEKAVGASLGQLCNKNLSGVKMAAYFETTDPAGIRTSCWKKC